MHIVALRVRLSGCRRPAQRLPCFLELRLSLAAFMTIMAVLVCRLAGVGGFDISSKLWRVSMGLHDRHGDACVQAGRHLPTSRRRCQSCWMS